MDPPLPRPPRHRVFLNAEHQDDAARAAREPRAQRTVHEDVADRVGQTLRVAARPRRRAGDARRPRLPRRRHHARDRPLRLPGHDRRARRRCAAAPTRLESNVDLDSVSYFVSRITIVPTDAPGMASGASGCSGDRAERREPGRLLRPARRAHDRHGLAHRALRSAHHDRGDLVGALERREVRGARDPHERPGGRQLAGEPLAEADEVLDVVGADDHERRDADLARRRATGGSGSSSSASTPIWASNAARCIAATRSTTAGSTSRSPRRDPGADVGLHRRGDVARVERRLLLGGEGRELARLVELVEGRVEQHEPGDALGGPQREVERDEAAEGRARRPAPGRARARRAGRRARRGSRRPRARAGCGRSRGRSGAIVR